MGSPKMFKNPNKHVHWYQGTSLKCSICHLYPWSALEAKEEKRMRRRCLGTHCRAFVTSTCETRLCCVCYNEALLKGNDIGMFRHG